MIPVQLTIQGLYSYQEKQTIDFRKLTADNLFGIFGTVGSGKSSILEAITFALYGKTDRLNLSGDNRNYNMMNLKSNELLIDFTFETGKAQTAYRALVKSRRSNKRFDDVKTLERTAYKTSGGTWIPVEPDSLAEAIGLSYENFKRTIIIPQGQFQEFLQLGNKDRTQMMKELFNLEKFELFYKVTSLEWKNNAQKLNIELQLQKMEAIEPVQIDTFEAQMIALKSEIEIQAQQLIAFQQEEIQWKQLLEQTKKLNELKQQLELLKTEETNYNELEIKLNQYEQCHIHFKSLLDAFASGKKKIEQKKLQIERENIQLNQIVANIAQQEIRFEAIKKAYDEREKLKQQAEELDRVIRIQTLNQQVIIDEERLTKGSEILKQTSDKQEKLKLEKEVLEQGIKSEKLKLPDLVLLAKVKAWHIENRNFTHQITEIQESILKFQKEIETINNTFQHKLKEAVFNDISTPTDIPLAIDYLQKKTEAHRKAITEIEAEADHLRVQAKLEGYASELSDGNPCPLCGSLHHPQVFSAASVAESLAKLTQNKRLLEEEITAMTHDSIRLNELANLQKLNNNHLEEQQSKSKLIQSKIDQHKSLFEWPEYQKDEAVSQAFGLAETIQQDIKKREEALDENSKQLDKLQKDKDRFQQEIDRINTTLTVSRTEVKTLSEQLKFLDLNDFQARYTKAIEDEKQLLLQNYLLIEKQFNESTTLLTGLRKNKDTLTGSLKSNQDEMIKEQKNSIATSQQLSLKLKENGYYEITKVETILAQTFDLEYEKAKLANFKQQLAIAKNQTEQLQLAIGEKTYDAEIHQTVSTNIVNVKQLLDQKNQDVGKVSELLKKLKKDLESQSALRKELEQLELRAENIKTLKSLFKGSGFVNYISSVYLQNLCNAANDRFFQMTRQKLSLEITEDNNFQVRDFMNGGKVRSVKTLSGGQTFQAALSLALALADNIQKITESNQNFFFLDEGFGSLDKESLAVVFETLKLLRRENRIVGVISHVEEMQQEIDTHLKVTNDPESGSKISFSWEY